MQTSVDVSVSRDLEFLSLLVYSLSLSPEEFLIGIFFTVHLMLLLQLFAPIIYLLLIVGDQSCLLQMFSVLI